MTSDLVRLALIEVDIQYDFCPGGALAVARGDEVVAPLNALARRVAAAGGIVAVTQDWHPLGHVSFAPSGPWPVHCVAGTRGAALLDNLDTRPVRVVLRKGTRPGVDSYSCFFENDRVTRTGLELFLRGLGVETVAIGGLATDYCVRSSALDAARLGFNVIALRDAVRGVGLPAGSVERAFEEMAAAGVRIADSREL